MSPVGAVVKSCVGRDRKRVFIVVAVKDDRLVLTDGRLRPTEAPKMKNPRHVKVIAHLTKEELETLDGADNAAVREILSKYDGYLGGACMQAK